MRYTHRDRLFYQCVRSTVDDVSAHGYHTIVPETCVGNRSTEQHESHLWDLNNTTSAVESSSVLRRFESCVVTLGEAVRGSISGY
jgi:hypothetical protein